MPGHNPVPPVLRGIVAVRANRGGRSEDRGGGEKGRRRGERLTPSRWRGNPQPRIPGTRRGEAGPEAGKTPGKEARLVGVPAASCSAPPKRGCHVSQNCIVL